ncbi:MAG TPA: hypothetical protein VMJ66_07580 [Geobacteraceae bacterium]|nr:hypothetical protein [Geobacteraceae bacterium]
MKWKEKSVFEIRVPEKYANLVIAPDEYLIDKFRIGADEKEVFSTEAAVLLTKVHPIFIWSPKCYCIFGLRTLFIASSIIPTAKINVGVLPANTPENEIENFILADAWLTRLAFETWKPEANLFKQRKKIPKDLLIALSPAFDLKVVDFAKVLGVSLPTLYSSGSRK